MSTNFFRKRKKTVVLAIAIFAGVALVGSTLIGAGLGGIGGFGTGEKHSQYQANLDAYEQEAEENPDNIENWLNLGGIQLNIGVQYLQSDNRARANDYFEDASKSFYSALELDEESVEALTNKALASIYLDDIETAMENIEQAYQISPDDPDVLNLYGVFYLQSGQVNEAIAKWEEILELEDLTEEEKDHYEAMIDEYKQLIEVIETQDKEDDDIEDIKEIEED